ncbi:response regulator [Herbaspirillum sp. WKF16]|jgi:CheY-like chemotaxis protein|uniref:response regulator n=1 Tax=Herbaspirillum sp. WKF16 TaxID=3028312 RepID=UPI0023A923FB|nr:response regulator [Herbaspirillum sp. WKF16]WDZ95272.1 response regulator [Herbaspirillum sp. WKF16]
MNKTALIAASRPEERRALTEWLAFNDIDTKTVPSGQSAIELMTQGQPDLVLAQVSMDDMSGLRLAHYLKAHAGFSKVPVILLCRDERELKLVDGQWRAFIFEAPLSAALISELKRELVN